MESSNPVFNPKTLNKIGDLVREQDQAMTVSGTINKTGFLILLTIASSAFAWTIAETPMAKALSIGALILNVILCLVIVFKKTTAPTLAPAYALIEGFCLGFISFWMNARYPGIAVNGMILTFAVVTIMLSLYHFRIIRVTEKFMAIVMVATLAIGVTYLVDIALSFFSMPIGFIHQGSTAGIIFSLCVVGVAALNLILDFDMIEKSVAARAPKWMEWYAGFAVLITVIWLYIEILRLLSKMNSRK
jgi:uncharacterized YccA/Bax inhibitor family protein